MAIYIFEPAGAGGSQTLQQVLTTGSTLTVNNTIVLNNNCDLNFNFLVQSVIAFGDRNTDGAFEFSGGGSVNSISFIGYKNSSAQGIYIDNKNDIFKFGDFATGNGSIVYEPAILSKLVIACVTTIRSNAPVLEFATDALIFQSQTPNSLTSASAGGSSGLHLIVEIDGNPYKINLLDP